VIPLLKLGGWMTFSGTLSQVLLYADRFLIGALLTLAAVAYYSTPLDLVLRMWILPVAVAQTLLPALAASFATDPARAAAVLRRGTLLILALVFPACLVLVGGAELLLRLWLGAAFAEGGGMVLRILGVGILFSCINYATKALMDAIGRPDLIARLVLAQAALFLPLSAAALWLGFGIEGAALVWALRAGTETLATLWLAARTYPPSALAARRLLPPLAVATAGLVLVAALRASPAAEVLAGTLALAGFAVALWRALDPPEHAELLTRLHLRPARAAP
jgi:O-antigen/teichoic acid export membrane protein